ncbi:glycosyltransferase family 4 protein [Bifidobacterium choloepi]|uniref:Glycosyltransferase family 4 protein n=1 Tax=Bifidobacterium choloepi TaxID=2614131 RepID=A0A6I5NC83_9BIFI|nr:glycosyltransferase family 4 protein [Bifidobacterium choloepi]NEG70140.1 glycosyltransferase family 4 protein [Bifidobacterium choloepi]
MTSCFDRPLTIGFLFDDTLDVLDGVQQHIVTLGTELARRGHDVHYLVGETHDSPMPNTHSMARNVQVRFNGNRMRIPLPASRAGIRDVLAANDFDILHVQAPYSPFMSGEVLSMAAPWTGVVATYHIASADPVSRLGGMALGLLNRPTHRRVDEVVAVSAVAAEYATATAGVTGSVIPNPVDVGRFSTPAAHRAAAARDTARAPHVVFLGRFVERKGASLLLDAIEYGERERLFPDGLHVTFAGKGPLLDECRARAASLRTPVEFLGFVDEEDKPALLASADVAVFPATGGESFGIVLLEAIAAGAGVTLAGDNPGYRSTFRDSEAMLFPVTPQDHARALATKIRAAVTSPEWAADVHARQQDLLRRYTVQTVADQVERVYARAIAKRRG